MQQTALKHDRFISLRFILLVAFTLVFTLIFAAAFYWFYTFSTDMAIGRITEDLVDTMQAAVAGINGDQLAALYHDASVREDGYTDDPRYWEQVNWLATVHNVEPQAMLYTYVKGNTPGELIFITSNGAVMDPPFGAKFRESWVTEHAEPNLGGLSATTLQSTDRAACTYGEAGCKLEPYTDDWGQWVSAFSPIKDSKGAVVAALGMDFQADYVKQVQDSIRRQILWAFGVTYLVLFVVVYFLSRFLTNPLILLTQSAEQIGEGEYAGSHEQLAKTSSYAVFADETTRLSQVFEIMVDKVYQREQTLRKQVEELKIEIDEVKRQKEVGDIVDTDFFRDLQLKARNMRSRRESQEADVESPAETGL